MMISHGSVLWPRALRWRGLIAHPLVPIGCLRHLPTRRQLTPGQFAAARSQAPTLEPAAGAA